MIAGEQMLEQGAQPALARKHCRGHGRMRLQARAAEDVHAAVESRIVRSTPGKQPRFDPRRAIDHHGVSALGLGDEADAFYPFDPCLHVPSGAGCLFGYCASELNAVASATQYQGFTATKSCMLRCNMRGSNHPCGSGAAQCRSSAGHSSILLLWLECFSGLRAAFFASPQASPSRGVV